MFLFYKINFIISTYTQEKLYVYMCLCVCVLSVLFGTIYSYRYSYADLKVFPKDKGGGASVLI